MLLTPPSPGPMPAPERRRVARHHRRRDPRHRSAMPRLEALEGRALLSTFLVRNREDSGAGSLRRAILDANASPGADMIAFSPRVKGTITLTGGRLAIT